VSGVVSAVLLGLSATWSGSAAAEESPAPGEVLQEQVLGHGKLGAPSVKFDESAQDELERRLAARGMKLGSPILIRIFKAHAELEVWTETGTRFELFATHSICNWSGSLGPKLSEGDKQSPEGFYAITRRQLRHSARWRRSLDIGFPNTFDRAFRRTGSDVLLHGGCTSTGCYAMTDQVMEEVFHLSAAALERGQKRIHVHVFPFRMTPENLAAHASSEWQGFWANLKEAYDLFERTRRPPAVSVCNKRYVVSEVADDDDDDDDCVANITAAEAAAKHRARAARRVRGRNALRAYAAARKARMAAKARQRQALNTGGQRKLPK
jgi:murein L,D-transpeptidase YafK